MGEFECEETELSKCLFATQFRRADFMDLGERQMLREILTGVESFCPSIFETAMSEESVTQAMTDEMANILEQEL